MKTKSISGYQGANQTVYPILFAISFSHLLNDTIQSLIPSIYPLIKDDFSLSFSQIGMITLVFQMSSSLFQPVVGNLTDRRPFPYALPIGMALSLCGLVMLAFAGSFHLVLLSVAFIGLGSSVFHPEASRMAHAASGGKRGLAQSIFQVGGNTGSSLGPLLAAVIVAPFGKFNVIYFSVAALIAIIVLYRIGSWYRPKALRAQVLKRRKVPAEKSIYPQSTIITSVIILLVLIFSKYFYFASITSYFTFYLIDKFDVSVPSSQIHLFMFLFAVAAGTMVGGPVGDRIGRKYVIWASILGAAPFTLLMPYANLFWTAVLSVIIGFVIASAFSAILVYAQELLPGKIGLVSGLFFGFAFGMGGIGSALLGKLADETSISYVYHICSFLPLLGFIAVFLPDHKRIKKKNMDK
ncbi:MFS transporter [Albibacterium indicum]|uniref:MFS transporter n=1 Tax=Albibacterium indicum TaxID=2292082 RepID=UPI000E539DD2|nr:MFS transporter [Pedobacter indicus]